jgi:invasion protein IalB
MFRNSFKLVSSSCLLAILPAIAFAQPQATPPAPNAAPNAAAPAADQAAQQFSINQNAGDWVVRCVLTTVKSPAPCEVLQVTVNKDNKQRLSSLSIAYVPSRDSYAMQIVVPTGVALAKGLLLGVSPASMKFTRCEQDGCYVETVIDNAGITSFSGSGKNTNITVVAYGKTSEIKFPVSLTGFPEAMDRMKSYAKERAVALPANTGVLPSTTAPAATAPAPAAPARAGKPAGK